LLAVRDLVVRCGEPFAGKGAAVGCNVGPG